MEITTLKYPILNLNIPNKILIDCVDSYVKLSFNIINMFKKSNKNLIEHIYDQNYNFDNLIQQYENVPKCSLIIIFENLDFDDQLIQNTILEISKNQHIIVINNIYPKNNLFLQKFLYRIDYLFTSNELNNELLEIVNKYEFRLYFNDKYTNIKIFC